MLESNLKYEKYFENNRKYNSIKKFSESIIIVAVILFIAAVFGLLASIVFNSEQMHIIRPMLAAGAAFIIFSLLLYLRTRVYLFGEIGFIYLALAMAYTFSPALKFLILDFNLPIDFDGLNFAILSPLPEELGVHFWRHVLFISGVIAGYLSVRGGKIPYEPSTEMAYPKYGRVVFILITIVTACIIFVSFLLPSANTYIEHYTRFENISSSIRKIIDLCLIVKNGAYFVILALMFKQYRKFKILIFIFVPLVCTYEVVFSFGSRIVAFTLLMAVLGYYHFCVSPISLKKSFALLFVLAVIFSGIGFVRSYSYSFEDAKYELINKNDIRASEFEAVYCTSFQLYFERQHDTLPSRDWRMFFNDFISIIPFVDHITYNPQYWYARNNFPDAYVPPTTMGVLADSAIWGGEWDLFARSLLNGAIFALLTRWFLRRREKWWALTIYIYVFATCIMTLKYSVLFQLAPLFRVLLPSLLLTKILLRSQHPSCSIETS